MDYARGLIDHGAVRYGARITHDANGHEVVTFPPDDFVRFLDKKDLEIVHRFAELAAQAAALGLRLNSNQLQFTLRDAASLQLYASGRTLAEMDEWVRRFKHTRKHPTDHLQGALTAWPPRG